MFRTDFSISFLIKQANYKNILYIIIEYNFFFIISCFVLFHLFQSYKSFGSRLTHWRLLDPVFAYWVKSLPSSNWCIKLNLNWVKWIVNWRTRLEISILGQLLSGNRPELRDEPDKYPDLPVRIYCLINACDSKKYLQSLLWKPSCLELICNCSRCSCCFLAGQNPFFFF